MVIFRVQRLFTYFIYNHLFQYLQIVFFLLQVKMVYMRKRLQDHVKNIIFILLISGENKMT